MQSLAGHTEKMVFSFLHPAAHKKAERKLKKAGINAKGFSDDEKSLCGLAYRGDGRRETAFRRPPVPREWIWHPTV